MNYVHLFGMTTNETYPYTSGIDGITGECKYDINTRVVELSGYLSLDTNIQR